MRAHQHPVHAQLELMSILVTDKFPASVFFETMNSALSSEADKKQAMDMGKGIYAFTLKNAAGDTDSWHIDLKKEGKVGKGVGEKPDGMPLSACALLSEHGPALLAEDPN